MKKGLISFILVLLFVVVYFGMIFSLNSFNSQKKLTQAKLIELENLSFKRNLLENTVDSAVKEEITKEIALGSDNPKKIKEKTALKLSELFNEMEKKGISVMQTEYNGKYSKAEITEKKAEKEFIYSNSETIVLGIKNRLYEVSFIFTGGIYKKNILGAELKENSSAQNFFVPAGYTIKTISLRYAE